MFSWCPRESVLMLLLAPGEVAEEGLGLSAQLQWFGDRNRFSWNFRGFYAQRRTYSVTSETIFFFTFLFLFSLSPTPFSLLQLSDKTATGLFVLLSWFATCRRAQVSHDRAGGRTPAP